MRNFLTSFFGTMVALVVFVVGGGFLLIGFFVALASAGNKQRPALIENGAYLVFDASANITDAPPPFDSAALAAAFDGNKHQVLQLRQLTRALRVAANDGRISGLFITGQLEPSGYGTGLATLKEVRLALDEFKASGKPIVAYLEYATTRDFYLTAEATELVLDPYGMIAMPGLASSPMFYAGALERFGIGVQVTRVGKYKSYVEPFIRKDMSPESREQTQKLLDDLWGTILADVAKSRGLRPEELQQVVDAQGILRGEAAVKAKLVSRLGYRDEVLEELKERTGRKGSKEPFKQVSIADYMRTLRADRPLSTMHTVGGSKIAVVYAEGAIVDGEGQMDEIGATKFARELRSLRQDATVKAIVLRVNSPGGSATGSEHINREIVQARKVKPVVVSMGNYAASGGYWISAQADHIFAEPNTITGSIGVFGIFFDVKKLANDLGLTFDSVKTGKFADAFTITRPKTEEELAVFQGMVDWIYDQFIAHVADGRHMERARVEEIAQGRVWSGIEAQKLGLVDEIGGLEKAVAFAAKQANLGKNYRIVEFPRTKTLNEFIAEALETIKPIASRASEKNVVDLAVDRMKAEFRRVAQFNDPQGLYARLPVEFELK